MTDVTVSDMLVLTIRTIQGVTAIIALTIALGAMEMNILQFMAVLLFSLFLFGIVGILELLIRGIAKWLD